jgi:hypothetical protein
MDTIKDFEEFLMTLEKHGVRYLIVGGLAFIYHAKPRYTKDIDVWVDSSPENVERVNKAMVEFGSPFLLNPDRAGEMLQIGVAPNRIDVIRQIEGLIFDEAWEKREKWPYGKAEANWLDLDSLIKVKEGIDQPRHQRDVKELLKVKEMRKDGGRRGKGLGVMR